MTSVMHLGAAPSPPPVWPPAQMESDLAHEEEIEYDEDGCMWTAVTHLSEDISATNTTSTSSGMTSESSEAMVMVRSITPPLSFRHVDLSPIPTDSVRTETETGKSTE